MTPVTYSNLVPSIVSEAAISYKRAGANMRQRFIFVAHIGFALLTALLLTLDFVMMEYWAGDGFMLADAEIALRQPLQPLVVSRSPITEATAAKSMLAPRW